MESIRLKLQGERNYPVQEAYKVLRTNLLFCGKDIHVVAVTSCRENEGKTTICLNLAKSLAELNKRVLVIDADMRKSVMAGRDTTAKNVVGLSEMLTGMNSLGECIYKTQHETLQIMFAGKYPPNPVELLNGKYFPALLEELRNHYDFIIVDTPPLGEVIDAAVVAPYCDGTMLVMSDRNLRIKQVQDVVQQLEKSGSKILGVIQNNTRSKDRAYYYRHKGYGYR